MYRPFSFLKTAKWYEKGLSSILPSVDLVKILAVDRLAPVYTSSSTCHYPVAWLSSLSNLGP